MQTDFDAVVVGAGPAGSAAAILLAQAGWSVALVEKQRFPRRKVCGECVAASNLPLLDTLGIGAAFRAAAGPELRTVALMQGKRQTVASLPVAAHAKYGWGRALGREIFDTLLLEQARSSGALVLQPWSVQGVGGHAGDWLCHLVAMDSPASVTLSSRVLIDAHGSWELLATGGAAHRVTRRGSDLLAFKANFRGTALAPGLLPVLSFQGGYGGMVVAGAGLTTVACCIRRDRLHLLRQASPGMAAGLVVETMLARECTGVRMALQGARRDGPWLASGPIDPGIRLGNQDAIFRIGNAAGEAHPIIGEGMSMALQSASLLCTQLIGAERREGLSDVAWQRQAQRRYVAQWHRQFVPRLYLAAAFAQAAMRPTLATLLVAVAHRWPGALTLGARWGGKVRFSA